MKSSSKYRGLIAKRLSFSMAVYYLLISVLIMRLGYIQIVNPEKYTDKAIVQQQKDEIIQPLRGSILDRNGKELAVSIVTYDILVEKIYVQDVQKTAEALSKTLEDVTVEEFKAKYDDDTKRFILRKNIPLELVEEIKQSEATGLKFEENSQRKYPYGQFGSFVIGHVSYDNEGIAGIESYMNNELKGIPGRRIVVKDAENREVPNSEIRYNEARNGNTIVLTIDEVLQHHVEKVTNQAYIDNNAVSVTSIVMNPKNGEILAMASKPDYDPNSPREAKFEVYAKQLEKAQDVDQRSAIISKMWRNPSVNDIYEPGSTFKLITASAALEEDKVFADEVFYDSGYVKIKDRTIKNWTSRPYGSLTFRKAVEESVNTVFVQVANRLGAETFRKYIEAFGYGSKTGIEIPGEAEGIIYPLSKTGEVELATMSFGQSISVTPLQMINSVAAIANEGKLLKPTLIKEIWDYKGNIIHRHEKEEVKASVSPLTASKVMDLMESVVKAGGENS
ncbi:MAG: peptidase, partial [Proteocatella sp.]|nr:peptidase [Proteocatella sp.]